MVDRDWSPEWAFRTIENPTRQPKIGLARLLVAPLLTESPRVKYRRMSEAIMSELINL